MYKTIVAALLLLSVSALGGQHYVATTGLKTNTGAIGSPWSLTYVLNDSATVADDDTVWIREGTYTGPFTSTIAGTAGHPITIRNYNQERVILRTTTASGVVLQINGSYTWWWGLEVRCEDATTSPIPNQAGIVMAAPGVKIINCITHDHGGNGISTWAENSGTSGAEIYGCISYYNGRMDTPEAGHAYGIYIQNQNGWKYVKDNIFFDNFGNYPIHAYAGAGYLDSLWFIGNVWFGHDGAEFFLGKSPADALDPRVDTNYAYGRKRGQSPSAYRTIVNHGWSGAGEGSQRAYLRGNLFYDGVVKFWQADNVGGVTGNTFLGELEGIDAGTYPTNTFDGTTAPTTSEVIVRPNAYEAGRGHIIVYNWGDSTALNVDVSSVLSEGDPYKIVNVENYFGDAVLSGIYAGGTVRLTVTDSTLQAPVTTPADLEVIRHTPTTFSTYVVYKLTAATILTTGSLSAFTAAKSGTSAEQTFTVAGSNITDSITVTAPNADFEVSKSSGSGFASSISFTPSSGTVNTSTVYVHYVPTEWGSNSGNISCTSTGATTQNVAVSGTASPPRVLLKR